MNYFLGIFFLKFYFLLEAKNRTIKSEASWAKTPLITWVFG